MSIFWQTRNWTDRAAAKIAIGITLVNLILVSREGFPQEYLIQASHFDTTRYGWLQLYSLVPIQKIWIDSLEIDVEPEYLCRLPAGSHRLQVRGTNAEKWFTQDFIDTVDLKAGDTLRIQVTFPEYKLINSDPYGAEVWIDGKFRGVTPCLVLKEDFKANRIQLKKSGFLDTTLSNVQVGFPSLWIEMSKDPTAQRLQKKNLHLKITQQNHQKALSLLTFGFSLASATAAYLLKKQANKKYEQYLVANNPADIDHLFRLTERYDRLSAGSYLIFEISLLTSSYFFFRYLLHHQNE